MKEKEYIFSKSYKCPVCDLGFKNLTVKQGKAKLDSTGIDLKPKYKDFEPLKYDVILCPYCGYAAIERYFERVSARQKKDIKEKISKSYKSSFDEKETHTFEEGIVKYKLAVLSASVKMSKESELGYLCLKLGWLYRSYKESIEFLSEKYRELEIQENNYLLKAYEYLYVARTNEAFPVCGMDEMTFDCLLAGLAVELGKEEDAKKLVSMILLSRTANKRIKEKARELKEILMLDDDMELE